MRNTFINNYSYFLCKSIVFDLSILVNIFYMFCIHFPQYKIIKTKLYWSRSPGRIMICTFAIDISYYVKIAELLTILLQSVAKIDTDTSLENYCQYFHQYFY